MGESAAGIVIVVIFYWVPIAWVFFDAEERDYSSYLWAGLSAFLWFAGVIIYYVVRSRRGAVAAPYSRGRIYLHVGLLTSWGLLMSGIFMLIWGPITWWGASAGPFINPEEEIRESLAFGLATILIAAPAFLVHWELLRRRIAQSTGAARVALARAQQGMAWLTVVVAGLIALLGVAIAAYALVGTLLDVGDLSQEGVGWVAATTLTAGISLLLSLAVFFTDAQYRHGVTLLATEPTPIAPDAPAYVRPAVAGEATLSDTFTPLQSPPPSAGFCAGCGAVRGEGARFCARCGVAFSPEPAS